LSWKNSSRSIINDGIPETVQVTFLLEDGSLALNADPVYMKRIITNLISNSLQALANGGKISIKVKRKADKALLSVEDTGQGIPFEVRDKIFMPLVSTKAKGQGFGLAVVKKLTEALNGTVTFESELGKGTQRIELPKWIVRISRTTLNLIQQ
jgi:signal transduction histidine kinase